MIDRQSVMRKLYWVVVATAVLIILFHLGKAYGSERGDTTTVNNHYVINKHNSGEDIAKGFVIGVVATCGAVSLWTRAKHNRWTWCGEPQKPEPLPSPGPTPLTITPDPVGVKVYQ